MMEAERQEAEREKAKQEAAAAAAAAAEQKKKARRCVWSYGGPSFVSFGVMLLRSGDAASVVEPKRQEQLSLSLFAHSVPLPGSW